MHQCVKQSEITSNRYIIILITCCVGVRKATLHGQHTTDNTPQTTLHGQHSTDNTPWTTLHGQHTTDNTPWTTHHGQHSTDNTPRTTHHIQHSTDNTPLTTLHGQHKMQYQHVMLGRKCLSVNITENVNLSQHK